MAERGVTTHPTQVPSVDEITIREMKINYDDEGKHWNMIGLWPWDASGRPVSSNSERSRESGRQGQPGPSGTRRTPPPPPPQQQQYQYQHSNTSSTSTSTVIPAVPGLW
ncbi:hypothetical protein B0H66DRAFT_609000 [Apodospora peruviana]|uniref:Uncharacterized protein n=1 Tax=Apodospora peruviana TaxID=516989 RepID=A0AAE0HS62_9PEZI|nr:hypothetical protein B0H66DRAFT_609000 [Apodospora peruviana]